MTGSITAFTQCSNCGVERQMRGQTRLLRLSVNRTHLPRLRGLTHLLCSSKWVGFDPRCGVWCRIFCVCKQKAWSAPAMYGNFRFSLRVFYDSSINSQIHHGVPILPPCELLPLHSAIQLQNMPVLCGKDHPMQRKLTPPLMTAADASLGACDLRMLTVYMSWLVSPHLAFADR